ncbi:hypothetical protein B0T25DRAFT_617400 [Lasiosphaeria hispida]|uniref:Uncharacterized protein n=1 Tax=Lasiosphaeria hispida TaxID=260671 RepID=A0AAJ0H752_9PEZI|nr:hypothetical protein B0T25DRAFT_617400 [Lasiosphaeria hispida]
MDAVDELRRATLAKAICMVVSRDHRGVKYHDPDRTDSWVETTFETNVFSIVDRDRSIHGLYRLPSNSKYTIVHVPRVSYIAKTHPDGGDGGDIKLGAQHNLLKVLFGPVQLLSGAVTLYKARADQIARFGIGAFGLTVIPYIFMSAVNTLATLACPEYPTLYLIRTPCLEAAE